MIERISPAASLRGAVRLPGDKSISHRYALLAAIAEGESSIENYATGQDCRSTLGAVRALGIEVEEDGPAIVIRGRGLDGLTEPRAPIDAGNSGSTIRMLSGILAAQPFTTRIGGDESLSRRPMERIMGPLALMGADIAARDGKYPPLEIRGAALQSIDYALPVASAQVKSCVLLAGLYARGTTTVTEPVRTRDHTEMALREFGAEVAVRERTVAVCGRPRLAGRKLSVPGDLSSAAFFLAAALLVPGSEVYIQGAGLNPTRSALLDFLISMGASLRVTSLRQEAGELVGDIEVKRSPIRGGVIEKGLTAALIDEIPVLAVLGAASEDGLVVSDASELRVKETDRIATLAENFRRMGLAIDVRPDGFCVPGRQRFRAAELDSFGDHRIAMAGAVAALVADGECAIANAEAASVSFPSFYELLRSLSRG